MSKELWIRYIYVMVLRGQRIIPTNLLVEHDWLGNGYCMPPPYRDIKWA